MCMCIYVYKSCDCVYSITCLVYTTKLTLAKHTSATVSLFPAVLVPFEAKIPHAPSMISLAAYETSEPVAQVYSLLLFT